MPWGVAATVGGALVSSALAPSSSAGGGGSNLYTPSGLGGADQGWQALNQSQLGLYNQGNPYAGGYQTVAGESGQRYGQLGDIASGYAGQLGQQAQSAYGAQNYLQGAGQGIYNMATDPQLALYNRTQQQLGDQVNAGQAQRGLGNSAVGGSEYNQAMNNFNIDRQNQQLNRATQGAGALGSLYGQAGSYGQLGNADLSGSLATGAQGIGYHTQMGQLPYQTAQGITGNQLGMAQGIQSQAIPYMNYGQGATANAYNAASQSAGATGALVGQGISALGNTNWGQNLFGSSTPTYGGAAGAQSATGGGFNLSPQFAGYTGSY
jgi:hypothetical protein